MRLALLKPAVGTASAVVFGYAVGSCAKSLKADGPSTLDRPLPLRARGETGQPYARRTGDHIGWYTILASHRNCKSMENPDSDFQELA